MREKINVPSHEFNLEVERDKYIRKLKLKVRKACRNAVRVTSTKEFPDTYKELLDESRSTAIQHANLDDDDKILLEWYFSPSEVYVSDPHWYPILLELALLEISRNYLHLSLKQLTIYEAENSEWFDGEIDYACAHEGEHDFAASELSSLKTRFVVDFWVDENGMYGYLPSLYMKGIVTYGIYKMIIGAPEEKSPSDQLLLGEDCEEE